MKPPADAHPCASPAVDTELARAYHATDYCVFLPVGECVLHIAQAAPALDAWLQAAGADCWALLTACNPASVRRPARENAAAQAALQARLKALAYPFLPGENRARTGDWPVEASFFVAGLPYAIARELARAFGQNAFLWAPAGEAPRLCWGAQGG